MEVKTGQRNEAAYTFDMRENQATKMRFLQDRSYQDSCRVQFHLLEQLQHRKELHRDGFAQFEERVHAVQRETWQHAHLREATLQKSEDALSAKSPSKRM